MSSYFIEFENPSQWDIAEVRFNQSLPETVTTTTGELTTIPGKKLGVCK